MKALPRDLINTDARFSGENQLKKKWQGPNWIRRTHKILTEKKKDYNKN